MEEAAFIAQEVWTEVVIPLIEVSTRVAYVLLIYAQRACCACARILLSAKLDCRRSKTRRLLPSRRHLTLRISTAI